MGPFLADMHQRPDSSREEAIVGGTATALPEIAACP